MRAILLCLALMLAAPLGAQGTAISTNATTLSNQRIETRLGDILCELEGH